MGSIKNFNFGNGIMGVVLEAALAAGASVDVQLPNGVDVAVVDAIGADGVYLIRGATTYSAKVTAHSVSNGVSTPGKVTFTAGSGGLAVGVKLLVQVAA